MHAEDCRETGTHPSVNKINEFPNCRCVEGLALTFSYKTVNNLAESAVVYRRGLSLLVLRDVFLERISNAILCFAS